MSSILKALKKLDREPVEKVEIRPLAQTLDTAKVISRPPEKRRSLRIIYLVALVLIIGTGGMLFSNLLFNNPAPEKKIPASGKAGDKAVTSKMLDQDAVKPVGLEKQNPLDADSGRQGDKEMAVSGAVDQGRAPHQAGASVGKEQASTKKPDKTVNGITRVEIVPAADVHKNIGSTVKVEDEQQRQKRPNPAKLDKTLYSPKDDRDMLSNSPHTSNKSVNVLDRGSKLPRLDYSVLRLQAVTWAVDPQDRFALVDNTILRKGESVKGFVIDSIHEEHVVVRKGSEKWRLEFRLR